MTNSAKTPCFNREESLRRLGGNRDLYAQMVNFFCEDAPQYLHQLSQALANHDREVAERAVHSLKGLAATFDAWNVTELSGEMEQLAREHKLDEVAAQVKPLQAAVAELIIALRK